MEVENQVQQQNEVNVETQPQVQDEPKMVQMTQEQLDKLISDRLARQERKLNEQFNKRLDEMSEAQKLAQMSEEERKEHDFAKRLEELTNREKALQERENAYNKQQYKAEIQRQLNEAGLPDISDTLVGLEAEVVKAQIDTMKQSFEAQINASIQAKIQNSASTPTVPQKEQQLLTIEQIKALSVEEYNANKELVQKSLQAMRK
jgi:hypothetical protein